MTLREITGPQPRQPVFILNRSEALFIERLRTLLSVGGTVWLEPIGGVSSCMLFELPINLRVYSGGPVDDG